MKRSATIRILLSALFAVLTLAIAWGVSRLPYSVLRDRVTDFLSWPGGLVAQIFYPAGVHTGTGSSEWGRLVFWANVSFYVVFWFVVLTVLGGRSRAAREERSLRRFQGGA